MLLPQGDSHPPSTSITHYSTTCKYNQVQVLLPQGDSHPPSTSITHYSTTCKYNQGQVLLPQGDSHPPSLPTTALPASKTRYKCYYHRVLPLIEIFVRDFWRPQLQELLIRKDDIGQKRCVRCKT